MGFFTSIIRPSAHEVNPLDLKWWRSAPTSTASGVAVTTDVAMTIAAVYACAKVISEGLAVLPLPVYLRRADGGRDRATQHPLYDLFRDGPNPLQTMFEFVEMLTWHAIFRGYGFAEIVPGPKGPVDQLLPIHPDLVTVVELADGSIAYDVRNAKSSLTRRLLADEMFVVRGLSLDGKTCVSVIRFARETIGLAKATETFGAEYFANGSSPDGVLSHPKTLSDAAAVRLHRRMDARHAGAGNRHKTLVLEEDMKWQAVGLSNEDSQFLESRKFEIEEVCRWFRMQPHKIAHLEHATFSNIEQQSLEHVTDTLLPWARRWEQRIAKQLIVASRTYYTEFLFDGLLRGDTLSRYQAYAIARMWGFMNGDDIREKENLNPIPNGGGKDYLQPANMSPAGVTPNGTGTQAISEQDFIRLFHGLQPLGSELPLEPATASSNGHHTNGAHE